ncbi:hypothetical protein BC940DRAFT_308988 [Gongronella butleri]|nr:hypothetical protein BC940DRAFT_308988 [Gongronella butleri]
MTPLSLCLLGMMFLNQLIPLTLGLKPSPRWANGCIILTGSLFCFGGQKQEDELSNELYRIDLSNTWDTSRPPWELVAVQSPTVERAYFAMTPCWTEAFIVNGGVTAANGSTASPFATYLYDTQRSTWGIPKIHGDTALRRSVRKKKRRDGGGE